MGVQDSPILLIMGFLSSYMQSRVGIILKCWGPWGPHLAVISGIDPPIPKGEATYNQWAFEVQSLQSHYQEEVLQEVIIWLLKGDTTDMVRFLGPAPSINAILDKLDSLYGSVSTSDVMMLGFYRESQGRSKSVAHYTARTKFKLSIWIESLRHKTAGFIRDHLFCGLRKPLWEVIHAKFHNPMDDYMVLMQAARKADGEHKQEKHNTSCASKPGMTGDVLIDHQRNTNLDPEAPTQEPRAKWVEMQQQLMATVEGTQSVPKKTQQKESNLSQRNNNQNASSNDQRPQRQSGNHNNDAARNNQNQTGRNDWNQIQCYNCQDWVHMQHECSVPRMQDF